MKQNETKRRTNAFDDFLTHRVAIESNKSLSYMPAIIADDIGETKNHKNKRKMAKRSNKKVGVKCVFNINRRSNCRPYI